jgi:hypothetical protein
LLAEAEKSKTQAAVNAAKVANTEADTVYKQAQAAKIGADIDSQGKSDVIRILDAIRDPGPRIAPSGVKQ